MKQVEDCMTELIECAGYALKSLAAMRLLDGDGYDVTPTGTRRYPHTLGLRSRVRGSKPHDDGARASEVPSRFSIKSFKKQAWRCKLLKAIKRVQGLGLGCFLPSGRKQAV